MAIVLVGVSALTYFFGFFVPDLQPPPFLGVTTPTPLFDWGALIGDSRGSLTTSLWLLLAPALALGICVLGFTLVGQALRSLVEERVVGGSK
jgi:ABC-type antimicrobial peptide transport system permease subunit